MHTNRNRHVLVLAAGCLLALLAGAVVYIALYPEGFHIDSKWRRYEVSDLAPPGWEPRMAFGKELEGTVPFLSGIMFLPRDDGTLGIWAGPVEHWLIRRDLARRRTSATP